ncbi:MAG: hypothetical protein Q9195_003989 [Heterodermia aff. obscurata]
METGDAFLTYLEELESYGLVIDSIYFDGYLPSSKQATRFQRLENYRQELRKFKAKHPKGVLISPGASQLAPASVTASIRLDKPVAYQRGIPAAPFFVASVVETLSGSKFADVTSVVPGEADTFCAVAARKARQGAFIFTNDSDLLIHDTGPEGKIAFLTQVDISTEDGDTKRSKTCETIRANYFQHFEIAQRLGVDNCRRLAFEIKYNPSTTVREAIRRAKQLPSDATALEEFLSEFDPNRSKLDISLRDRQIIRFLDPRISELILQTINETSTQPINMYLPVLIEDPDRASAWNSTTEDRAFAYSCLQYHAPTTFSSRPINEVFRKGDRIATTQIAWLNKSETSEYARRLLQRLQKHQRYVRENAIVDPYGIWRSYAVSEAMGSEISTGAYYSVLRGEREARFWSWKDVQLAAHIEAILYSLRILGQILRYLVLAGVSLPKPIFGLYEALVSLPRLKIIMATRLELLQRVVSIQGL